MAFEAVRQLDLPLIVVSDVTELKAISSGSLTNEQQASVRSEKVLCVWAADNAEDEDLSQGIVRPDDVAALDPGRWLYAFDLDAGYGGIEDDGSSVTPRPTINFVGDCVSVSDDAANSRTNISFVSTGGGSDTIETFNQSLAGGNRIFSGPPGDTIGAVVVFPVATTINGLEAFILQSTGGNAVQYGLYDASGNLLASTLTGVPGTVPAIFPLLFSSPVVVSAGRHFFAVAMAQGGALVSIGGVGSGGLTGAEIAWQDNNNLLPNPAPISNALTQSVWMKAL